MTLSHVHLVLSPESVVDNIVVGQLGETSFASVSRAFDRAAVQRPGEVALDVVRVVKSEFLSLRF